MPALTSAAISARDLETRERELINEFLRRYFGGAAHTDDAGAQVTFEHCAIEFNQVDVRSLDQPLIHWTFTNVSRQRQPDAGGMLILADVLSTVFLQVAAGGKDNEREHLCARLSDQFTELLESKLTLDLAAKGIQRMRLMRGPTPLPMAGVQTRIAIVRTHLEYLVRVRS